MHVWRWVRPACSRRWWMCWASACANDTPRRLRRTIENAVSAIGMAMASTGTAIAATIATFATPATDSSASISPRKYAAEQQQAGQAGVVADEHQAGDREGTEHGEAAAVGDRALVDVALPRGVGQEAGAPGRPDRQRGEREAGGQAEEGRPDAGIQVASHLLHELPAEEVVSRWAGIEDGDERDH